MKVRLLLSADIFLSLGVVLVSCCLRMCNRLIWILFRHSEFHGAFVLPLNVDVPIFGSKLLHRVLLVLSFKVAFKFAELGLDLVFSVLADHLDGA